MGDLVQVFGIDWRLMVAQAVNFAVLVAVLGYFVYGPVMRLLAERAKKIAEGIADAAAAKEEREAAASERSGIVSEARHQAETIIARAQDEGKNERMTIVKQAQDRAAQIVRDADLAAAEGKRKALKDSEAEVARAAVLAAEKILRNS
ncbi:F0F1 ATP synthase subunit B [Patescibacteria group bacterium]|nr:F0F1 ATP synthase subunit B [Patescibacteria group bacterium]